jgi:hypothetical protein
MVASSGRPPRDPRIEDIVRNVLIQRDLFCQNARYAGDDENPRPLPKLSLADWKRYTEFLWQNSRREGFQAVPSALYFAFYNDRFAGEEGATVSMPRAHLWWLVAPGDSVLLSDGIVHHYTMVSSVDRATKRIAFADPWEDRLFLKQDLNMAGVAAIPVEGMRGLTITGEEFERVVVGLETIDTPKLLESYLDQFPAQRRNSRLLLEFALAILDAEREDLTPTAAAYADQALFAALLAPAHERESIAAILYLALNVALHKARASAEPLAAKPFADRLYRLLLDYTEPALQEHLSIEQLCRMANAAGWAQDFDRATQLFQLAIERQPNHVQARHLRASAFFHRKEFSAAIDDALVALEANAREIAELQHERDALDPRGAVPITMADQKLAGRRRLRSDIYAVLTASCGGAGRWKETESFALEWHSLRPDDASPLAILARAKEQAGEKQAASQFYLEAAEREPNGDRQRAFRDLAAEVIA